MDLQTLIVLIIELIGTIAFSISGAMVGIRRKMDIFGVLVLGVVTAVGGGMMRDVILGKTPSAFVKPIYVEVAVISALAPFLLLSINKRLMHSKYQTLYAGLMFLMDSVGLGIFTAVGVSTGWTAGYHDNMFFLSFLGVLTGVGGGLLVKHVYACASIAGAICCVLAYRSWGQIPALVIGTVVVLVIRIGAAHYRWNLPCVKLEDEE